MTNTEVGSPSPKAAKRGQHQLLRCAGDAAGDGPAGECNSGATEAAAVCKTEQARGRGSAPRRGGCLRCAWAHMSGSMTRSSGTWRGSEGSPIMWSTPAPMD